MKLKPNDWYIAPEEYDTAKSNGVGRVTLNDRIRVLGWDKNRAIIEPVRPHKKLVKWRDIAIENGISANTFYRRVGKGWTKEKASTEPVNDSIKKAQGKRWSEDNRVIPKWALDKAKENGIAYNTLYSRIHLRGWEIEKASTIPPGESPFMLEARNKFKKEG